MLSEHKQTLILLIKLVRTILDITSVVMISGPLHIMEVSTGIIRHTFKEIGRIMVMDTVLVARTLVITATVTRWHQSLVLPKRHQITYQMQV